MEKEIILNKIAYLKENIQKAEIRLKKVETEKNSDEKETLELAIKKIIEEIVESGKLEELDRKEIGEIMKLIKS